jgi:hypothetical protein
MAMDVKDFVQNCLHCVATIPKDKFPQPAGYADTRKSNEILHFSTSFTLGCQELGSINTYHLSRII